MAVFSIDRAAFTPATNQNNWALRATTAPNAVASVIAIGWGGRGTSSQPYRTRWAFSTAANGISGTSLTVSKHSPGSSASNCSTDLRSSGDTLPADPANLFAQDWDVHGGHGELFFSGNGIYVSPQGASTQSLICMNTIGTDANLSNYWVMWEE